MDKHESFNKYFVISNSDGDTNVYEMSEKELKESLDPEDPYFGQEGFIDNLVENSDTNYWGKNILIIKGEIIVPKPKQKVTEYEL